MKSKIAGLAEVEVDGAQGLGVSLRRSLAAGASPSFVVQLPEGGSVAVFAGFDPDDLFNLLTVLREAGR